MCRHLVYLGAPATLSEVVLEPPHSLLHQSYAPRDMRRGGTMNVDGYGVGWYADGRAVRYRRDCPMWTDVGFAAMAKTIRSGAIMAAIRSATLGMPINEGAAAPFADETWLFSHNGAIDGWPASVAPIAEKLPVVDLLTLDAPTDAALLWALVRHRLRDGAPPAEALRAVVGEVLDAAPKSRLNLLLTDGATAVATTVGHSLSVRQGEGRLLIASEPFDDAAGWEPLNDRRLIVADRLTYTVEDLCG